MINHKTFKKLSRTGKIIYALVIGVAVVLFWRGVWGLADLFLFPSNELNSYIISVVIALILLIGTGFFVRQMIE